MGLHVDCSNWWEKKKCTNEDWEKWWSWKAHCEAEWRRRSRRKKERNCFNECVYSRASKLVEGNSCVKGSCALAMYRHATNEKVTTCAFPRKAQQTFDSFLFFVLCLEPIKKQMKIAHDERPSAIFPGSVALPFFLRFKEKGRKIRFNGKLRRYAITTIHATKWARTKRAKKRNEKRSEKNR